MSRSGSSGDEGGGAEGKGGGGGSDEIQLRTEGGGRYVGWQNF